MVRSSERSWSTELSDSSLRTGGCRCLLCGSHQTTVVGRLDCSQLTAAYRSELRLAVEFQVEEILYVRCSSCDLLFFSPPITGDARFYGELQQIRWYYSAGKQEFHLAANYITGRHRVLEIGAGHALFTKEIAPASYTGLEFSPSAIQAAAEQRIRLLPEPVEQHAISNPDTYDVVCAFQVLEHVSAPHTFLEASVRCLKPGGRLILSVPAEDSFARLANWDVLNMPPHHVTRWTDACLRSIAPLFGLRLIALTPELLGRNMVRLYAGALADQFVADSVGMRPMLLDRRLRSPMFRAASNLVAACTRPYLKRSRRDRRGHAVLAVFEK